ncbi:MAG: hypothetical protein RL417_298 [Pseudomonadota bacterium]|jgi:hypothetical protein
MRFGFIALGISLFFAASVEADNLPTRKPGLWKMTVESDGETQSSDHCVDAATDKKMQEMGQGVMGGKCAKNEVKRSSSGYTIDSECTFGGSKMISKAEFKGNFDSGYEGTIDAKFEPPFLGQTASTTKMSAKFQGPCQAGQKPGDIVMEGFTMNIDQMAKFGQGMPGMTE